MSASSAAPAAPAAPVVIREAPAASEPGALEAPAPDLRWRWSVRHIVAVVAVLLLAGLVAYRGRESVDPSLWREHLVWPWMLVAVTGAVVSLSGSAWNLIGATPTRLRFAPTMAAQCAGTLARLVSPTAIGASAVNVVYLRRAGLRSVPAVGAVSVAQTLQVATTLVLLPVLALLSGVSPTSVLPSAATGGWILAAACGLAGVGAVVLRRSPRARDRIRATAAELARSLRATVADPRAAVVSVAGSVLLSAGLVAALWGSVHAFGGQLAVVPVTFALLVGSTAGNAVPVPAGLGSVDAALVATLGASGVPLGVAIPAVGLFRLVTLWLQIPAAVACAGVLRRRRYL